MSTMKPMAIAGAGLLSMLLMPAAASAQGYGHGGYAPKHNVCYVEVQSEPQYGLVKKAVIKEPGRWEVKEYAAKYGEVTKKYLVKPGEWEVKITPAVYEEQVRKHLVYPERTIVHYTPPVIKYEKIEKKVVDHYGHEQVVYVEKPVIVEPEKKTIEKKPAVYKTYKIKVIVKPEHHEKVYHQPVYETKVEKVVLQPAYQEKHYIKPIYDYVEEKVLVKPAYIYKKQVLKPHGEPC